MRSNLYIPGARNSHRDQSMINVFLPAVLLVATMLVLLFAF